MNTVAIIQARVGSTRLPGKVMMDLCGRTVLARVVERLAPCSRLDRIVVATTDSPADRAVADEARRCGVGSFRGEEQDVLDRFYRAALRFEADIIVRITADCPVFDPELLTQMLDRFFTLRESPQGVDVVTNTQTRSFPRGLDAEILPIEALTRAQRKATDASAREHVTPYLYRNRDVFRVFEEISPVDLSMYRWTLDTPDDFRLIEEIYCALDRPGRIFTTAEVFDLLERRPELRRINADVRQKHVA
jgi:spore coat polysaccharide biosynthesis protein SpsF